LFLKLDQLNGHLCTDLNQRGASHADELYRPVLLY
jgi:hypothetical protein